MEPFSTRPFSVRHLGFIICLIPVALLAAEITVRWRAHGQGGNLVTTVSAASFEAAPVAPEAIVAAFGSSLATRVEVAGSVPLPTSLAGTSVKVKDSAGVERLAPLFFVAPSQVNYLVPAGTANGAATITITNGDGLVSTGTVQIARVAPGVFTANASGQGVAAAVALRVKADGSQTTEPVMRFDQAQNRFVTAPIDPGAEGEQVFLILFATGVRGRSDISTVTAKIGGVDAGVLFAGPQGGFVGLDQINVRLPRSLAGRGRVNLAINITNGGASNLCELEVAASQGALPPLVTSFGGGAVLASQNLSINGQGFAPNQSDNLVRIGGVEARVLSASTTQLSVRVPFGAQSGPLSVRTPQGEWISPNPLLMRTSVSGFIEDTNRQPLPGVVVRVIDTSITATTSAEGSFILPDVAAGNARDIEIDATRLPGSLPYPKLRLKLRVLANRDNQLPAPVAMQQATGPSLSFGTNALASRAMAKPAAPAAQGSSRRIQTGGVIFEVPDGAGVSFPDGGTSGSLTLSIVENSRTPVSLPAGQFSQVVSQVTPFGAILLPGAKLIFPNSENYAPGTPVKLFRLDQTRNSPTIGSFVEAGVAVVSADGQRIETAPNAITEATIYFVSNPRPTTTVTGRVVDSDGKTPVRQALVRSRGQEAFTDGNGGFVLRGVVVNAGDLISVEASFVRSNGRVDRTQRSGIAAAVGGVTNVTPDLVLPSEESNRPPVILAPTSLAINEGETRDILFVAADPDANQTIQLSVTGANFASITSRANDVYALRLTTRANDAGRYTLMLTATDILGLSNTLNILLVVNRPPIANAQSVTTDQNQAKAITLTGSDPDNDPLSFIIVSNPLHGRLSGTVPNLIYTPATNYSGSDNFTFKVNDGLTDSNVATVSIVIRPINQSPILIVPGQQTVNTGENLSFTITASDPDSVQTLTFTATDLPGGATFNQVNATSARFSWTPSSTQAGGHTVTFTVRDNGSPALSTSKDVTITVAPRWVSTAALEGGLIIVLFVNGTNLFAGTQGGGVFLSTDEGQSWTPVNSGLTSTFVRSFAVSGTNLFAGTEFNGVFVSIDQGQSWRAANSGLPTGTVVSSLVVSGTNIFAGIGASGFAGAGVFISTDQGQSWRAANSGIENMKVLSLAVSGANMFAGSEEAGVFRSTNSGQSWTPVNTGLINMFVSSLAVSGTNLFAGTRGGGVHLSTDNGQNWIPVNSGLTNTDVVSLTTNGANLFAGTQTGVFLSTNNGQSWTRVSSGLPDRYVQTLAVNGANLFAGTNGRGVFRSTNNGQSWTEVNSGLASTLVFSLAVNGPDLFAGTSGGGVYRSINNGQSWIVVNDGLTSLEVTSLAVSDPNIFAGTYGRGIFLSTNRGQSWRPINTGLTNLRIRSLIVSGADLLAGTEGGGVFLSTNQGQSWTAVNAGLTNLTVLSLAVSGTSLYAGTNGGGVFLSTNQGQSWMPVNSGLPPNSVVQAIAVSGTNLFAGILNGVFVSTNNGQSWSATSLTNENVQAFAVSGLNLFAGTYGGGWGGVFLSTNQGQSWTPANTGLTNRVIFSLAVSGSNLFAGTFGGGVFISK